MTPKAIERAGSRRSLLLALLKIALVLSFVPGAFGQSAQPPATILLIRHAEKLTDGQMDLSPVGFERAKVIPELFGGPAPHNLPRPDFLFATHVSKKSNRPVETITPLSVALKLPIDSTYADDDYASLAKLLLSGKYAGKVVLVAWHHGKLSSPRRLASLPNPPRGRIRSSTACGGSTTATAKRR
jgi:hypothetical protein